MRFSNFFGALALAFSASAQNTTYCSGGACYAIKVPASTASSGTGDIFFQISGPSTMSWIGLGQGDSMSGANIFMMYANSAATNVTLSPRLGVGKVEPKQGSTANVTLLSGSGISNGKMTANVKCSNCNSWSGGSMSFTDANSNWIWAYHSGSPVSSDDVAVNLPQHSNSGTTNFNLRMATGGNSANPFTTTAAIFPPASSSGSSGRTSKSIPSDFTKIRLAHGVLASIAFVIFMPLGSMAIRTLSFKGLIWIHAGWMMFAYIMALAAMGMGVWIAITVHKMTTPHAIIGLVVIGSLLLQPITGLAHHLLYKRSGRPNAATYPHIWWGRAIITLAIINGGPGLQLAWPYQANTKTGAIVYSVVAGVIWLLWMAVIAVAFLRSRGRREGEAGEQIFTNTSDGEKGSAERMNNSEKEGSPLTQSDSALEVTLVSQPGRAIKV